MIQTLNAAAIDKKSTDQFAEPGDHFYAARQNMVDGQVRTNKVTNHALIRLLRAMPREIFVGDHQQSIAYIDENIELNNGRFLLQPMVQARLIQETGIAPGQLILDVGCGAGYSSMLMAQLGATVVGIDRDADLIARANNNARAMGVHNCSFVTGAMLTGHAPRAPYDAILINGSVAELPAALCDQIKENGSLLCVLKPMAANANNQIAQTQGQAMIYRKTAGIVSGRALFDAACPYIEKPANQSKFTF